MPFEHQIITITGMHLAAAPRRGRTLAPEMNVARRLVTTLIVLRSLNGKEWRRIYSDARMKSLCTGPCGLRCGEKNLQGM